MKLKIELKEGTLVRLRRLAVAADGGDVAETSRSSEASLEPEKRNPRNLSAPGGPWLAGCRGLEPLASGVTGRRYNRLN